MRWRSFRLWGMGCRRASGCDRPSRWKKPAISDGEAHEAAHTHDKGDEIHEETTPFIRRTHR
jgi:hypothetical protein